MLNVSSNAAKLAAAWEKRARALKPAMTIATKKATDTVYAASKRNLTTMIYDKPIPSKNEIQGEKMSKQAGKGKIVGFAGKGVRFGPQKGGGMAYKQRGAAGNKPAWRRTGNLRRSERRMLLGPYLGVIINDASRKSKKGKSPYARARHDMKNTRYPAPWRSEAEKDTRPAVALIYRNAMRGAMRLGIVSA